MPDRVMRLPLVVLDFEHYEARFYWNEPRGDLLNNYDLGLAMMWLHKAKFFYRYSYEPLNGLIRDVYYGLMDTLRGRLERWPQYMHQALGQVAQDHPGMFEAVAEVRHFLAIPDARPTKKPATMRACKVKKGFNPNWSDDQPPPSAA